MFDRFYSVSKHTAALSSAYSRNNRCVITHMHDILTINVLVELFVRQQNFIKPTWRDVKTINDYEHLCYAIFDTRDARCNPLDPLHFKYLITTLTTITSKYIHCSYTKTFQECIICFCRQTQECNEFTSVFSGNWKYFWKIILSLTELRKLDILISHWTWTRIEIS